MTKKSNAASSNYPVVCPTCGSGPNEPCRTKISRRVTDTHTSRINLYYRRWFTNVRED